MAGANTSHPASQPVGPAAASNAQASAAAGADLARQPLTEFFQRLDSSAAGLSQDEAQRRLERVGPNEPGTVRRAGPLVDFLGFCANPLVIILLCAAAISAVVGEVVDATIIAIIMALSIALNFFQTYRSQKAVERLRAGVAPTATALRDGRWIEVPRRTIVPGDAVRLSAGDLVPADARLLESRDLHVQQAALTGESLPAEKSVTPGADLDNLVYLGTSVISGIATAMVYATGRATQFGDIAMRLAERPPESEFERGAKQFGILIMETVFVLVLFILLVNISLHRNALESLLFAVALAVGLTPEFLPMITTVTLSTGAVRMARKKVIVKHLAAIQNFGSIDVLCTDKTGTLTSGEMSLDQTLDALGRPAERALFLGSLNSRFETGIRSPLDSAILKRTGPPEDGYRKTDEIPFDFERRMLSIVVEKDSKFVLIAKGAPETVVAACTTYEDGEATRPLDDEARKRCEEIQRALGARGFRVLAVAYRAVERGEGLTVADERELRLAGFLTFSDPPIASAAEAVAAMRRDGVAVKVLTGDGELVARHVCSQVGIDVERIVLGEEIERLGDVALAYLAEAHEVFARVSPAQKNRIIRALKARSHVVGFMGDGINDAPSLRAADVGISVANAVDVAKDSAEIILLEPSLDVLHAGIIEGRKAFGNVFKYLLMGTSSNFGNMFSMAAATLFLPFLPMLPTQILLNNFLYDLAQITIPTDNVDRAYIVKPQRWDISMIRNFMLLIGPISSLYDFLTFFILLQVFHASEALFHSGWFVESLATQTLVLFVIRTVGRPWSDRPSMPLAITTIAIVIVGAWLPFTRLAKPLGFVPLPLGFFLFLVAATVTYLALVEVAKHHLMRRLLGDSG
ncbi:MAG TPA: magnesium-translocating P-type ATPase [Candidatus Binataceae bacterium]|nr:magnesium-translocating P-type ATPase [Candidatus Binataceae bacterium]